MKRIHSKGILIQDLVIGRRMSQLLHQRGNYSRLSPFVVTISLYKALVFSGRAIFMFRQDSTSFAMANVYRSFTHDYVRTRDVSVVICHRIYTCIYTLCIYRKSETCHRPGPLKKKTGRDTSCSPPRLAKACLLSRSTC